MTAQPWEVSPLIGYGGEGVEFLSGKSIEAPDVVRKEDEDEDED